MESNLDLLGNSVSEPACVPEIRIFFLTQAYKFLSSETTRIIPSPVLFHTNSSKIFPSWPELML